MRRAANIDGNHHDIVKSLRKAGFIVIDTHQLGDGFPDLLVVNKSGRAALMFEVKQPENMRAGKLEDELQFMIKMVDPVYRIITSPEQAIEIIQAQS